jgi:hypothetical protein
MKNDQLTTEKRKGVTVTLSSKKIKWAGIIAIVVIFLLFFHISPDKLLIFPKESPSFSNTFFFQSDIDKLIERYNNAGLLERIQISQDPFFKKLVKKRLVVRGNNVN